MKAHWRFSLNVCGEESKETLIHDINRIFDGGNSHIVASWQSKRWLVKTFYEPSLSRAIKKIYECLGLIPSAIAISVPREKHLIFFLWENHSVGRRFYFLSEIPAKVFYFEFSVRVSKRKWTAAMNESYEMIGIRNYAPPYNFRGWIISLLHFDSHILLFISSITFWCILVECSSFRSGCFVSTAGIPRQLAANLLLKTPRPENNPGETYRDIVIAEDKKWR